MSFHEKLMELRKEKGWSQEQLGDQLDVSRQTVSKWELGQTTPEMDKLIELSRIFEISLDEMVNNEIVSNKKETIYITTRYHYEYKSKRHIGSLPLIHVNIGNGIYKAKGVIAIGTLATGILSIGILSLGLLSFGALSIGLLAFGAIALGILSFGGLALGAVAFGGLAIGIMAIGGLAIGTYSIGGGAIASKIAVGGYASGHIAIGDKVKGAITFHTNQSFENIDSNAVREAFIKEFPHTWSIIVDIFTFLF